MPWARGFERTSKNFLFESYLLEVLALIYLLEVLALLSDIRVLRQGPQTSARNSMEFLV